MGCNCGNKAQKEFQHTRYNGQTQTHPTLLSARAAQVRDQKDGNPPGAIREVEKVRR